MPISCHSYFHSVTLEAALSLLKEEEEEELDAAAAGPATRRARSKYRSFMGPSIGEDPPKIHASPQDGFPPGTDDNGIPLEEEEEEEVEVGDPGRIRGGGTVTNTCPVRPGTGSPETSSPLAEEAAGSCLVGAFLGFVDGASNPCSTLHDVGEGRGDEAAEG